MNKAHPMLAQAKQLGGDKFVLQEGSKISFAFNDPNSTSGFLVPGYYVFAQNGVDPKKLFKQLIFSGSHEATALAVANNQVDVATNNNESLTRLETSNPDARAKIEVIWTSPQIPSDPISYRKDLPEDLKKKVQDFFFTFNDKSILDPLQWSTFKPADDSRWNVIRELEYGKQILEIQSSESISQADKEKQVTELQQKIAELKK
jgi:phosphonate transport system substrate-binding protein